jgi:hypothetical protein
MSYNEFNLDTYELIVFRYVLNFQINSSQWKEWNGYTDQFKIMITYIERIIKKI